MKKNCFGPWLRLLRLRLRLSAPFCCQLVVACNINFLNLATSQETENSWP